jgi:hypothetical protein
MGKGIRTVLLEEIHNNPRIDFRQLLKMNLQISITHVRIQGLAEELFKLLNEGFIVAHESSSSSLRFISSFERFYENVYSYKFSISEKYEVCIMASVEYGI